jgi:hypothetical protein
MNRPTRYGYAMTISAAFAAAAMLGACGRPSEPQQPADAAAPAAASAPPVDAPASTPKPASAETAKASDEPMKSMSKDEEATSMPRPAQANDHSTLAKDPQQR